MYKKSQTDKTVKEKTKDLTINREKKLAKIREQLEKNMSGREKE
jgi:hypothetical protein